MDFYLLFIYLMWTIFKVFIELVTILLPFNVLVFWFRDMWVAGDPACTRSMEGKVLTAGLPGKSYPTYIFK